MVCASQVTASIAERVGHCNWCGSSCTAELLPLMPIEILRRFWKAGETDKEYEERIRKNTLKSSSD
jgi:hypothetical protein